VKRLTKALVAIACLMGVTMLAPTAHAATDVPFTDDNVSRVTTAGSDTTYFLLNDMAVLYNESEGCVLNSVALPLVAASPQQNRCNGATTPEGAAAASQVNALKTANYDHDIVINLFPQGSSAGRRQLCAQLGAPDGVRDPRVPGVDIARSSAGPSDAGSFQCSGATALVNGVPIFPTGVPAAPVANPRVLRFIAFARDALTWVRWDTPTGASDPVANLTQAQLNDIFADCTITNWNQVGGGNGAIQIWTAVPASGSRDVWDGFVGGESDSCIPGALKDGSAANGERLIREHFAPAVEDAIAADIDGQDEGNSIFFFSTGVWNTNPGNKGASLLGNVNGIVPDDTNIGDGTFPFTRLLYNVIIQSGPSPVASEATRRFTTARNITNPATQDQQLGFICKPESAHGEPLGTPGAGVESAAASQDYGQAVKNVITSNGFFMLTTSDTASRCQFADYRVDTTGMVPV
jgi:ABC-type phosphate transport system substrate-binding protein